MRSDQSETHERPFTFYEGPHPRQYLRIVLTAGQQVLRSGGVVRGIENWGVFQMPKKVLKNQMDLSAGHYFCMRFDASGPTQEVVRSTMSMDPRVIKVTSVKLGDGKLGSLSQFSKPEWKKLNG
ncbi:37S ribosomal protein MRP17 mitochondrial [Zalerion maritima]|uniref:37S ribosomal protein MRP17 mitochondrial n=1 Tax=Zalerion maritima TaxID=339359 RepID=A0AAD5RYA0_9PEZI|nr:37S ribosomal protein MRP17 mitochondrial [Zalerion maritima]